MTALDGPVHMRAEPEGGFTRGSTWVPMCDAAKGKCGIYPSAVTCPDCLRLLHPGGIPALDLMPLAEAWATAREAGEHERAETLIDAVVFMSGATYEQVFDLVEEAHARKHGPTIRYVHAPF